MLCIMHNYTLLKSGFFRKYGVILSAHILKNKINLIEKKFTGFSNFQILQNYKLFFILTRFTNF